MKSSTKYVLIALVLVVAAYFVFQLTGNVTAGPGEYDDFAQCLTESGTKMYGAYWCPHCQNQKTMFGNSWQYVDYVECDPRGNDANPQACQDAGIQGYPTWVFPDGSRRSGELPLRVLAQESGCSLTPPTTDSVAE